MTLVSAATPAPAGFEWASPAVAGLSGPSRIRNPQRPAFSSRKVESRQRPGSASVRQRAAARSPQARLDGALVRRAHVKVVGDGSHSGRPCHWRERGPSWQRRCNRRASSRVPRESPTARAMPPTRARGARRRRRATRAHCGRPRAPLPGPPGDTCRARRCWASCSASAASTQSASTRSLSTRQSAVSTSRLASVSPTRPPASSACPTTCRRASPH